MLKKSTPEATPPAEASTEKKDIGLVSATEVASPEEEERSNGVASVGKK